MSPKRQLQMLAPIKKHNATGRVFHSPNFIDLKLGQYRNKPLPKPRMAAWYDFGFLRTITLSPRDDRREWFQLQGLAGFAWDYDLVLSLIASHIGTSD